MAGQAIPAKVEAMPPPTIAEVYTIATTYGDGRAMLCGTWQTEQEARLFMLGMSGNPMAVVLKVTIPLDAMRLVDKK